MSLDSNSDDCHPRLSLLTASNEQLTGTPQLPIDPPRRRSSLGFSKIAAASKDHDMGELDSRSHRCDVSIACTHMARVADDSCHISIPSPPRHAQSSTPINAVNANLHIDMQYAASPTGSIDSRLFIPATPSTPTAQGSTNSQCAKPSSKRWRYSTVPSVFATTLADVREPIHGDGQILPQLTLHHDCTFSPNHEPPSSGHMSPSQDEQSEDESDLPPLPPSSPPTTAQDNADSSELELRMLDLEVHSQTDSSCDETSHLMAELTSNDHMHNARSIFLPQSARAAADYAREKRGFARDSVDCTGQENDRDQYQKHNAGCNKPLSLMLSVPTRCPDPMAHIIPQTPHETTDHLHIPLTPHAQYGDALHTSGPSARITAAGSPMPFANPAKRFRAPRLYPQDYQRCVTPQAPVADCPAFQHSPLPPSLHLSTSGKDHFQPGWYYTGDSTPLRQNTSQSYAFSTAAAKASGESTAPDMRIRDSYRTDTLTPLAKAPSRFRKNGIGAEIRQHMVNAANNQFAGGFRSLDRFETRERTACDVPASPRFRNGPSRPEGDADARGTKRDRSRRAQTPDFEILEDGRCIQLIRRFEGQAEAMRTDTGSDAIKSPAAVIRELSPNVRIWRKGVAADQHTRKKRRPSYWDDDLQEVKMSPAGRGGIASSPVMSKSSMMAEVESINQRSTSPYSDDLQRSSVGDNKNSTEIQRAFVPCATIRTDTESTTPVGGIHSDADGLQDKSVIQNQGVKRTDVEMTG